MNSPSTNLLHLQNFILLQREAKVTAIHSENGKSIVILDQTVFYPQGGGQPYDTGAIESPAAKFTVEEVRFVDPVRGNPDTNRGADSQKANRTSNGAGGIVHHIGKFSAGSFAEGENVRCLVQRREVSLGSQTSLESTFRL